MYIRLSVRDRRREMRRVKKAEELITPLELKTIEVDVDKKIFKVNGKPFGENCTFFSISCDAGDGYRVRMELDARVHLAEYREDGTKRHQTTYEVSNT